VPPIWPEPIKAILSRAMGNLSFEHEEGGWKEAEWLVIPFDRPVQVAPCAIVGPALISIRTIPPLSFRGASPLRANPGTMTMTGSMNSGLALARPGVTINCRYVSTNP